jgi:hypothetical protein
MSQVVANPHLRAELACFDGQGKLLAGYLRTEWPPQLRGPKESVSPSEWLRQLESSFCSAKRQTAGNQNWRALGGRTRRRHRLVNRVMHHPKACIREILVVHPIPSAGLLMA